MSHGNPYGKDSFPPEEVLRRMPDYAIDLNEARRYPTIPLVNGYIAMPATFTPASRLLANGDDSMPLGVFADAM